MPKPDFTTAPPATAAPTTAASVPSPDPELLAEVLTYDQTTAPSLPFQLLIVDLATSVMA